MLRASDPFKSYSAVALSSIKFVIKSFVPCWVLRTKRVLNWVIILLIWYVIEFRVRLAVRIRDLELGGVKISELKELLN